MKGLSGSGFIVGAAVLGLALLAGGTAGAAELPKLHVKSIGYNANTVASTRDEVPFWKETVPKDSNGRITADIVPVDQSGIKDFQLGRIAQMGATDFVAPDISKLAGDDPVFEGCDLAGLTLTWQKAREACKAWQPVMNRVMQEKFDSRILAIGGNPPQVVWCRDKITGLDWLKGKKVRVFNKTMSDFIEAVGGTTISMSFGEVVPALQRGVVDCAVTGSLSGNTAGWPEVSDYLYPMTMGWSINAQVVTLDAWNNKFNADVRAFFEQEFAKLEEKMWDTIAAATADADDCNFGYGPCDLGKQAKMTEVPVGEGDKELHKQLMENVVLVRWGQRCGRDCAAEWNDTVGKVVGLRIPLDKI